MRTWAYPAVLECFADDEWLIRFPDIPEALTSGDTRSSAIAQGADALEEALLAYLAAGRAIPSPRPALSEEVAIDLDPVTAARIALSQAMTEDKISNVSLAGRLNKSEGAIRRLVDGQTGVKIETVLEALHALGRRAALVSS